MVRSPPDTPSPNVPCTGTRVAFGPDRQTASCRIRVGSLLPACLGTITPSFGASPVMVTLTSNCNNHSKLLKILTSTEKADMETETRGRSHPSTPADCWYHHLHLRHPLLQSLSDTSTNLQMVHKASRDPPGCAASYLNSLIPRSPMVEGGAELCQTRSHPLLFSKRFSFSSSPLVCCLYPSALLVVDC